MNPVNVYIPVGYDENMNNKPDELSAPSWSELDVLVIITVNDLTRHQFTSLDRNAGNPLEDGIYIAGARKQDVDPDAQLERYLAATVPAVCEIMFGGFESIEEATEVCDEIYELRTVLPEGNNSLGKAAELWIASEQDDTIH